MSMKFVIGIDPGKAGGIASIWLEDNHACCDKLPATERDIYQLLESYAWDGLSDTPSCLAVIERVSSSPQMGVRSAFTFGKSYGFLRGCLTGLEIPFREVTPFKWQRALGCLSKGDKNITKARAQQLFPQLKITHATADALLIAQYALENCCSHLKVGT